MSPTDPPELDDADLESDLSADLESDDLAAPGLSATRRSLGGEKAHYFPATAPGATSIR